MGRPSKYNYDEDGILNMILDGMSVKYISDRYNIPYNSMKYKCNKILDKYNERRNNKIKEYKDNGYHIMSKDEFIYKMCGHIDLS